MKYQIGMIVRLVRSISANYYYDPQGKYAFEIIRTTTHKNTYIDDKSDVALYYIKLLGKELLNVDYEILQTQECHIEMYQNFDETMYLLGLL